MKPTLQLRIALEGAEVGGEGGGGTLPPATGGGGRLFSRREYWARLAENGPPSLVLDLDSIPESEGLLVNYTILSGNVGSSPAPSDSSGTV